MFLPMEVKDLQPEMEYCVWRFLPTLHHYSEAVGLNTSWVMHQLWLSREHCDWVS